MGTLFSGNAGIYNNKPELLPKWRKALASVHAGQGNARVLFCGDSTTFGNYTGGTTGTSSPPADLSKNAYTNKLRDMISSRLGYPVSEDCFGSSGNVGRAQSSSNLDARWSMTAGGGGSYTSIGGPVLQNIGAVTMSFTPRLACDTFKVWYLQASVGGSYNININGGTNTPIASSGSNALLSQTITGTLGTNTLNIVATANYTMIAGIEAWNSAQSQIMIMNAGWNSATSTNWNDSSQAWSPINALPIMAHDLVSFSLGINDIPDAISPATFLTNMQALITAAKANSDVILIVPAFATVSSTTLSYIQIYYQLAQTNNIPLIDQSPRFASNSNLFSSVSGVHPNALGHVDFAKEIFQLLGVM